MLAERCRICAGPLFPGALLVLHNMPGAAQHFPTDRTLPGDTGADVDVRQCRICGTVQLANDPVPYYRDVIRAAGLSKEMTAYRRQQFAEFIASSKLAGKTVLEVGCGRGEYLALLDELPVHACGLEHHPEAVQACRDRGLQAIEGFPGERCGEELPASCGAFLMLNVLEHLPDPTGALGVIHRHLEEGGWGLVEAPNFDMILERKLFAEFINDHLFYFTRATLRHLLEANGFEVVSCDAVWQEYILSARVRKRAPLNLAPLRQRKECLGALLREEVGRRIRAGGRVAVWGAGHQALALLALSGIAGSIAYVVDSAPFKQGRYTPATHLPVVPPSRLATDPVTTVLVMAAGYSDEVGSLLARDHPEIETGILREAGIQWQPGSGHSPAQNLSEQEDHLP